MNDLNSVVAALRPRHDDDLPTSSTGSTGSTGVDQERAAAMLAAITAQPRHDNTGSGTGSGPVTTFWRYRPARRVLVGAAAAVVALGVAGTVAAGVVANQDRTGGDAADCIPRLRHDGIVYIQQTVIEHPADDNATGRSAFGRPAGTAVVGTCNDDGTGDGPAGGPVTFPADGPKVDVVELTDVAPTLAVVRPQSDGSAAVFIAENATAQQVERILAEVPAEVPASR